MGRKGAIMKKVFRVKSIIYGLVAILLVFTVLTLGCAKKEKEIKIGAILSLTGRVAKYGEDSKRGIDLALEEINNDKSYPFSLKVIYEDDRAETAVAVSALRKLIDVDKVPIIVGFILSNNALACAPIAESEKVNLLITCASAEKIKYAGDYIFRIRESALIHGKKMAKYARNILSISTAACLFANAENGYSYSNAFKEEFLALGGEILISEKFEVGEKDFRSLITKAKEKSPDAVYLAGLPNELGQILYQARELNFKPKYWLGSAGADDPKLIEIAKDGAEGFIISSLPFDPTSPSQKVKDFIQNHQNIYGSQPDVLTANGYDAIYIIAEVIKNYGKTAEDIKNGLYLVKDFEGVGGKISFDEYGEAQRHVLFRKVIDGKFQIIR